MKKIRILFLLAAIILSACNPIPTEAPSNDGVSATSLIPAVLEQEVDVSIADATAEPYGETNEADSEPDSEPAGEPEGTGAEDTAAISASGSAGEADTATPAPDAPPTAKAPAPAPANTEKPRAPAAPFTVYFINVGQADSALVLCDGSSMLIDGGNAASSDLIYTFLKDRGITQLDYIVATHAHEDHVGGLAGALNYATASAAFCSVTEYNSRAFESFVKYLDKQNISITVPKHGDAFKLGSANVKILGPIKTAKDANNTSIVIKITFGDTAFLFAGDAERAEEQDILEAGYDLAATVLKVGHHGSDTSTTYPFLREIMPKYAVISCGKGNSFGHPHDNLLSRLRDADVTLYRTDMQGTITCTSDGKTVTFTTERNANAHTNPTQAIADTQADTAQPAANAQTDPAQPAANAQTDATQAAASESTPPAVNEQPEPAQPTISGDQYIGNINSKKYHRPTCSHLPLEKNRVIFNTQGAAISAGYSPCGICKPQ